MVLKNINAENAEESQRTQSIFEFLEMPLSMKFQTICL